MTAAGEHPPAAGRFWSDMSAKLGVANLSEATPVNLIEGEWRPARGEIREEQYDPSTGRWSKVLIPSEGAHGFDMNTFGRDTCEARRSGRRRACIFLVDSAPLFFPGVGADRSDSE